MGRSEKRLHSLGEKSELELKVSLICINKKKYIKTSSISTIYENKIKYAVTS